MKKVRISSCERKLVSGFITSILEFIESVLHVLETSRNASSTMSSVYIHYVLAKALYFVLAVDRGTTSRGKLRFSLAVDRGTAIRGKLRFSVAVDRGSCFVVY